MVEVLKADGDQQLAVYIVWLPMFAGDSRGRAEARAAEYSEPRVTHLWDEDRLAGHLFQNVLGLDSVAWDVYLLYEPGAGWAAAPDRPDFWMHQLGDRVPAPVFDKDALAERLRAMHAVGEEI